LLAAGVAHEVNTPLAVISSYTQMLAKQLRGYRNRGCGENHAADVPRIRVVNNLLNFSRTSGTEFANVDINKVITDTLALLEHQFKVSKIKVESELTPNISPIQGNPGRLQQVFLNLFLNAKDAMPGGGRLTVATTNGEMISVRVSDTGSGIAPSTSSASTIRSLRPRRRKTARPAALGSDFPSPTASSRSMREKFAWRATPEPVRHSHLIFP
jgi:signal transduction histidine kinase